jgi:hypothetical protein
MAMQGTDWFKISSTKYSPQLTFAEFKWRTHCAGCGRKKKNFGMHNTNFVFHNKITVMDEEVNIIGVRLIHPWSSLISQVTC